MPRWYVPILLTVITPVVVTVMLVWLLITSVQLVGMSLTSTVPSVEGLQLFTGIFSFFTVMALDLHLRKIPLVNV